VNGSETFRVPRCASFFYVDEKARFPSEAIELVKETKFEATDAAANDPFSLPSGQGTRTKSADRELKTELIVRLYDDLDGGWPLFSANCH
jgi:hypothetical protein